MRAIWKGSISFGLLNVPVKLGAATRKKSIRFRTLHKECGTPIKQVRFCPTCNKEVEWEDTVKGYEYETNKFVILDDEDFDNLPVKSTKTIDIVDFVQLTEIDPVYYIKTYYLQPAEGGEKPYLILKDALQETGKVAITKVTLRNKESLAVVRVLDDVLALETMFFPAEVRSSSEVGIEGLEKKIAISEVEMKMAVEIVNNLTAPFHPEKYTDEYRSALLEMIRKKAENEDYSIPEPVVPEDKVVNLMDKLRASVEATRKEREARREPAGVS
ncbi:MAG: Ku protein [Halanaerobium sp.]|nr:Ku protein [Halanaerobium sp.]